MYVDGDRLVGLPTKTNLGRSLLLILGWPIAAWALVGWELHSPRGAPERAPQESQLSSPQSIAEGAKLFGPICGNAYCHGSGGAGGGAPRLRGKGLESAYIFKAIWNGIPGSAMPSFKTELSQDQVWKLVAFVMSDASQGVSAQPELARADKPPLQLTVPAKPSGPTPTTSIIGSAQDGKALFFDSGRPKSCYSCHSFNGEGTAIGPDLTKIGGSPVRELFSSIIFPGAPKDSRYATVTLTLRNGDKVIGVKKEEDADSIRVYDTMELPAVLRTVQQRDVVKVEMTNESVMPKDYAATYTLKQLLDLITFLRSSASKSTVTLKDLVN